MCNVDVLGITALPLFGQEYCKIKLQKLNHLTRKATVLTFGVGLIYFAAYPTISEL